MTKKNNKNNKKQVSEEEFLRVLDNISKKLVYKFKFGYHDVEDMKQQAAIFALEGLEKYDHTRPLENFLWTHVRNRLFNYKRNNYQRPDKPCLTCPLYDPQNKVSTSQCSKYSDKQSCDLYKSWLSRNNSKKNIMQPSYIDYDITNNVELINDVANNEIINFLDINIDSEFRETYLRLKHGEKIPKQKLVKLQNHINNLMKNFPANERDNEYD
jgi:hypothetical protein